ncbi:hypothetical protein ACK8HH_06980 [Gordonia sp. LUNF6]|uniref:hypothetical protein n=1 Tax=Gordonia sp. LUNF6 TaxID=3388658 RepID=UPI00399AF276
MSWTRPSSTPSTSSATEWPTCGATSGGACSTGNRSTTGCTAVSHCTRHRRADGGVDWDAALAGYNAVRPEHCRRVLTTSRAWGELWHLDGESRTTALDPEDEPAMFTPVPLSTADALIPREGSGAPS